MTARLLLLVLLCALGVPAWSFAASRLTNVSVRSSAGSANDTLIVGFTVSGPGTKQILLRGIGPTLRMFGVTDAVPDPELRLYDSANAVIAANDNWSGPGVAAAATTVGAFALPANSADAALVMSLRAGTFSAHVEARTGGGIALVEAYDTDAGTSPTQITNLAARSLSGPGASVLTVGFAISGDAPKTVLIRAVGPTLGGFGVTDTLANPQLRLFNSRRVEMGSNDDWPAAAGWAAAFTATGAFPLARDSRDAVLLVQLPPGAYTAQAAGASDASGIALVEIYDVPNPPASSIVLQPVENVGVPTEPIAMPPRGSGTSVQPVPTFQARPQYPFDLRAAGLEGETIIDFIVNPEGRVVNAYILRATDLRFGQAGLVAVQRWLFQPGTVNGVPVNTHMQVPIVFQLSL